MSTIAAVKVLLKIGKYALERREKRKKGEPEIYGDATAYWTVVVDAGGDEFWFGDNIHVHDAGPGIVQAERHRFYNPRCRYRVPVTELPEEDD